MIRALVLLGLLVFGCGGGARADASADAIGTEMRADTTVTDTPADVPADTGGAEAPVDAGSCNPAAVMFPRGGALEPGTLCDELYACADDAAGAARIQAAAPKFSCMPGSEPQSACTAYTCAYRDPGGPSTLDESEIAEICALTLLTPTPLLRCVVFVSAP